jgi:hypothetical protein
LCEKILDYISCRLRTVGRRPHSWKLGSKEKEGGGIRKEEKC